MSSLPQNIEDAASIASEFIYKIDNLPQEVAHLLNEIKHKEKRRQELQQEVDKDSAKYIRHSLRAANSQTPAPSASSSASSAPTPSPPNVKLLPKIAAAYDEINKLSEEKCILAQQLVDLISRARSRLDVELGKVHALHGEDPLLPLQELMPRKLEAGGSGFGVASKLTENLKNVLAAGSPAPSLPQDIAVGAKNPNKKRRIGVAASVKVSPTATTNFSTATQPGSSSPAIKRPSFSPYTAHTTAHQRSRLQRQVHQPVIEDEPDADAEEDAEGDDDDRLYCFCRKRSYGDMIACDNDKCEYEWFHLSCVGMKQPLPDKWYCSDCIAKGAGQPQPARKGPKGRKK